MLTHLLDCGQAVSLVGAAEQHLAHKAPVLIRWGLTSSSAWRQGAFSSAWRQRVEQRGGVAVHIVMTTVRLHVSLILTTALLDPFTKYLYHVIISGA